MRFGEQGRARALGSGMGCALAVVMGVLVIVLLPMFAIVVLRALIGAEGPMPRAQAALGVLLSAGWVVGLIMLGARVIG